MLHLLILALLSTTMALICYETDERGKRVEVSDPTWEYCVLIPETSDSKAKLFGLAPAEDSTSAYATTFQQTDNVYKVLSVCLYEKYDLRQLNPRFGKPEFLFRCICNSDRCNAQSNFDSYLTSMRRENS